MSIIAGQVVQTPGKAQAYKVVLQHDDGRTATEHPVATVREGEALIRDALPVRPAAEKMREWVSPVESPPADPPRLAFGPPAQRADR